MRNEKEYDISEFPNYWKLNSTTLNNILEKKIQSENSKFFFFVCLQDVYETKTQNLWEVVKAVIEGKFLTLPNNSRK